MSEALQEVVNYLNSMVETKIIPLRLCGNCVTRMWAIPLTIDLNSGRTPHGQWRPIYLGNVPRWHCPSCDAVERVSTDHFLMALDFRSDAVAYQSTHRRPIYTNFPVC